jgi:uncharacterized membrane protein
MKSTMDKTSASRSEKRWSRKRLFWLTSCIIGFVLGVLSVIAGYLFINGQVEKVSVNIGYWYTLYGLMILLGSFLVLIRRIVLIGAVIIVIPSFLVGPQSFGLYMPSRLYLGLALPLGWILPVVSFVFALLGREPDR